MSAETSAAGLVWGTLFPPDRSIRPLPWQDAAGLGAVTTRGSFLFIKDPHWTPIRRRVDRLYTTVDEATDRNARLHELWTADDAVARVVAAMLRAGEIPFPLREPISHLEPGRLEPLHVLADREAPPDLVRLGYRLARPLIEGKPSTPPPFEALPDG